MSLVCEIRPQGRHERVISESLSTKEAHRALFRFDDDAYQVVDEGILNALHQSVNDGVLKIHFSGGWDYILRLALCKDDRPSRGEVFYLLKTLGLSEDDLRPFVSSDVNDIFHYLYYGKRFDIMRRLCHRAKKRLEAEIVRSEGVKVECHLVAEDNAQIVASSL